MSESVATAFDADYFSNQYRDYASQNPARTLGFSLRVLGRYILSDRPANVLDVGRAPVTPRAARSASTVAVSVDLDAPQDYAEFYGKPWQLVGDRFLAAVLPRFLELFADLGIRATFFAIARDARSAEGARVHRMLTDAGHEVANHTLAELAALWSAERAPAAVAEAS